MRPGSTKFIVKYCETTPSGSVIAIGTGSQFDPPYGRNVSDKTVLQLSGDICPVCANIVPHDAQ